MYKRQVQTEHLAHLVNQVHLAHLVETDNLVHLVHLVNRVLQVETGVRRILVEVLQVELCLVHLIKLSQMEETFELSTKLHYGILSYITHSHI